MSLGKVDTKTTSRIKAILKGVRKQLKGLSLYLELKSLEPDDDIPEYIYESLEPYCDPESGEVFEAQDTEIESAVWALIHQHSSRGDALEAPEASQPFDALVNQMAQLALTTQHEYVVQFSDGSLGYADSSNARKVEQAHMTKAMLHYFEPTHQARTHDIAAATDQLVQAQEKGESKVSNLTAGELIIGAAEALRTVYLLKEELEDFDEKLFWESIPLSLQRKPSEKNRGNLFIRNLGTYGSREPNKKSKKGVIEDLEELSAYADCEELALVMSQYGSRPYLITKEMLNLPDNEKGTKLLTKFQQNLFLIFCAEIFRYFPIEGFKDSPDSKKMPYAIALGLGLELLVEGHITLQDLFDKDARYGLPTGTSIMDNSKAIAKKAERVLTRYQRILKDTSEEASNFIGVFGKGYIVQAPADFVCVLEATFGRNLKPRL